MLKDKVTLDGAGHTIQGNGTDAGIYMRGVQGVTVENFVIKGFNIGINTYTNMGLPEFLLKTTSNNSFINNTSLSMRATT